MRPPKKKNFVRNYTLTRKSRRRSTKVDHECCSSKRGIALGQVRTALGDTLTSWKSASLQLFGIVVYVALGADLGATKSSATTDRETFKCNSLRPLYVMMHKLKTVWLDAVCAGCVFGWKQYFKAGSFYQLGT